MNEYRCGTCGWTATAPHPEGIIAASAHHTKTGCAPTEPRRSPEEGTPS